MRSISVSGQSWRHALAWRSPRRSADPHLIVALLASLPVWAALGMWAAPWLRAPAGVWSWLSFILVMPLLEELVFRGLLQGHLLRVTTIGGRPRRWGGITLANGLTTLAFLALHLPSQPLFWALAVAAPSLVFGHLRERLDSVWPAIGLHVLYNAGFGLTALWAQG